MSLSEINGEKMFKLQAKTNQSSKHVLFEVFVVGDLKNALKVANKLMLSTSCEFVEVFKKAKGELITVLKKPVSIST